MSNQLIDDLISDKAVEVEEVEEEALEQDEAIITEEQLEIESYQSKIAELDEQLATLRAESITDSKRKAMRKVDYNDDQIERYLSHIEGETDAEIKASVLKLTLDIPPVDPYVDPSPMNWAKAKPTHADPGEMGKTVFQRIKHKIPWRSLF